MNEETADNLRRQALVEQAIECLKEVEDHDLIEIMRTIFSDRVPFPDELSYSENHYFLGVANRHRLDDDEDVSVEEWSQWRLNAVAYVNRDEVPVDVVVYGPGFCQYGECINCGTKLLSNSKSSVCPICGYIAHLS